MRLAIALVAALIAVPAIAADFTTLQPGPRSENGAVLPNPYSDAIALRIDSFHGEGPAKGLEQCTVSGEVLDVYRGLHYRKGETAVITVPCGVPHVSPLQLLTYSRFAVDRDWLTTVRYAVIQLDDKGQVVLLTNSHGLTRVY